MRELYQVWPSGLSADQVDQINAIALRHPVEEATIFAPEDTMRGVRACTVRWLKDDGLEALLWSYVEQANHRSFQVDVARRAELQVVQYTAARGAHYDWHHDVHWNGQSDADRKVSVTVQLSDTSDYEGGDFEFEEVKTNADFRSKGTVLVFPSYLRHRVHPITSGTRRALVAWFYGPRWT